MAKRKRKTTRRRKSRTLSAGGGAVRRRRSSRRSRGLSDMFNPTVMKNSAKTVGAGALGGLGAAIVNKMLLPPTSGKLMKLGVGVAAGVLLANFGAPNIGAGFAAGQVALAFQNGLLADDDNANFTDPNSLNDAPIYLDDDGNPMVLEEGEDGSSGMRYLDEDEIDALNEAGAFDQYEMVN